MRTQKSLLNVLLENVKNSALFKSAEIKKHFISESTKKRLARKKWRARLNKKKK
jgi:hypothetical protein